MQITIITGGSRGIGRATARAMAEQGHGIILTYNANAEAAEVAVAEIAAVGGKAVALPLDVSRTETFGAFRQTVEAALEGTFGQDGFDILVNNAGYGLFAPIEAVTEAQFDGLFSVHLKGPFFLTQALLPLMRTGGQILNICSATSRVATAGVAPYAAFKGGLEVLTRYMAKEFGPRGLRANAVAPGAIRTELGGGIGPEFEALLAGQTVLGRIGEADEVGRMIASLASPAMGWVNAQTIEVGGGYCI